MCARPEGKGSPEDEGLGALAQAYRKAGPYLSAAWALVASVGVGIFAGRWLDKKLGTDPWLLLAGAILGMVAGFIGFFRAVLGRGTK